MSEQNVATVRKYWQAFNDHNLDAWDEVCTSDFVNHDPGLPTPDADLTTIKQTIGAMQTAFPDMRTQEIEVIADGNSVAVHQTMRGTHKENFMGIPATNKQVSFSGVWLAHLSNGKLKEQWVYFNALGLLQQLGAIPPPG